MSSTRWHCITQDRSRSPHERYLELFRLMERRDDQLAEAFNDPAHSRMLVQLATIQRLDLLVPGELGRFSQETRDRIVNVLARLDESSFQP